MFWRARLLFFFFSLTFSVLTVLTASHLIRLMGGPVVRHWNSRWFFPSYHGCGFLCWKPHPLHSCSEKWLSPGQTKECSAASWLVAPPAHPCCCRHLSTRGERCGWRDAGLGQLQGCMPEGRMRLSWPQWLRTGCWEGYFRPHRCTDVISALFGITFMARVLLQGLRCEEWDLQITSRRGVSTGKLQFLPILVN